MLHSSSPPRFLVTALISLVSAACGSEHPDDGNLVTEPSVTDADESPADDVSDPGGPADDTAHDDPVPDDGAVASSGGGQSGGEGAARYHCWCDNLSDRVVVRARVVDASDTQLSLEVLEVLGRHILEPTTLVGQTVSGAYSDACDGSSSGDVGAEVLGFYKPAVIGRTEGDPCAGSFAECSDECALLTAAGDDAPSRCLTGCSLAADLECGPIDFDLNGADPATWVVVPWSDPRVQQLSDPHALGMSVDDLEGVATCNGAVSD